jgi:phage terminase large subunit-like protein
VSELGLEVLRWAYRYLPSPSDPSKPLVLTDPQARFVLDFYERDDAGDFVYRRAALEGSKGSGKSPLGAVLALAEFAGPPAPPIPWVQIAAVNEEQAQSNVYSVVWTLLSENDGRAASELGVDLGRTRLHLHGNPGAKLEAVTSSWGAREGQRVTFALLDESHHWLKSNGGLRLARVLRRNAAKVDGRTVELANAPETGEGSIAEETEAEFLAGAAGVLLHAPRPSREPTPEMTDDELVALLAEVYRGAEWVELRRLLREIRDPGVPWPESLRFYFNVPSSGVQAAVALETWRELACERELVAGEPIALGFDGSHSRDGTALVGCTQDGWLWPIEILERPVGAPDDWRVDRGRIHRALEQTFQHFDVQVVYADPWMWHSELQGWSDKFGEEKILEFPTNSRRRMSPAVDRFRSALIEGHLSHAGDADLERHVGNARLRPAGQDPDGRGMYILEKAGPGRLIDACVAAVLAYEAHGQLEEAKPKFIAVIFE